MGFLNTTACLRTHCVMLTLVGLAFDPSISLASDDDRSAWLAADEKSQHCFLSSNRSSPVPSG